MNTSVVERFSHQPNSIHQNNEGKVFAKLVSSLLLPLESLKSSITSQHEGTWATCHGKFLPYAELLKKTTRPNNRKKERKCPFSPPRAREASSLTQIATTAAECSPSLPRISVNNSLLCAKLLDLPGKKIYSNVFDSRKPQTDVWKKHTGNLASRFLSCCSLAVAKGSKASSR